jgi:hypothetical protein
MMINEQLWYAMSIYELEYNDACATILVKGAK